MSLFGPPNVEKLKEKSNIKGLIKALGYEKDDGVRDEAAEALKQIGNPAVEMLIVFLKDDKNLLRIGSARVLGAIGNSQAIGPLKITLDDGEKDIRQAAAKALDKLDWQPDQSKSGAAYWIINGQWDQCVEIGEPAIEPLFATLKDDGEGVRQAAIEALAKIGEPAVTPLITKFQDEDQEIRSAVIVAVSLVVVRLA